MLRVAILLTTISTSVSAECIDEYYESINLKGVPVEPFRIISRDVAAELEKAGGSYFVKQVCDAGERIIVIHRQNHTNYNKFDYLYENGKIIKSTITNPEGKVFENDL